jgi:hypothetical protein
MIAHPIVAVGVLGVLLVVLVFFLSGIIYAMERLQGTRMSRNRHIIGVIGIAVGVLIALKVTFFVIGILYTDLEKLSYPKSASTQDKQEGK